MKQKVVIIGANEFQNPLILKAKELGYETHVFSWREGAIGEKTADYFYPISIIEKEEILEKCKEIKPVAVVSIGSDLATITVNYVADKLGLPCNDPKISLQCTNKYEMRKIFKKNGIEVPYFLKVSKNDKIDLKQLEYPVIVKPTDRSGSRGIFLCNNDKELLDAIENACNLSFKHEAIIEKYIEGDEYSCECITQNGIHNFLAITKKYTTGSPNFIEKGHIQSEEINEELKGKVLKEIFKALDSLGITNSASHSEFKIDKDGKIKIIEIGARMGGDCIGSHLVQISTGYDFLKMTLDVALGKEIKLERTNEPQIAIIKFIFNDRDIKILKIIKEKFERNICYLSNISSRTNRITDSSSRYGFFILKLTNNQKNAIEKELKKQQLELI